MLYCFPQAGERSAFREKVGGRDSKLSGHGLCIGCQALGVWRRAQSQAIYNWRSALNISFSKEKH